MRPKAELVNATINVLDRVPKEYLTVCQTEVTTKNIEFSFVINRLMVKYVLTSHTTITHFTIADISIIYLLGIMGGSMGGTASLFWPLLFLYTFKYCKTLISRALIYFARINRDINYANFFENREKINAFSDRFAKKLVHFWTPSRKNSCMSLPHSFDVSSGIGMSPA